MSAQPTEKRYGTLRQVAEVLTYAGFAAALIGLVALIYGVSQLEGRGTVGVIIAVSGIAGIVLSIPIVASGERLQVVLDTEENTRRMAQGIDEMIELLERIEASTVRTAAAVERLAATVAPRH